MYSYSDYYIVVMYTIMLQIAVFAQIVRAHPHTPKRPPRPPWGSPSPPGALWGLSSARGCLRAILEKITFLSLFTSKSGQNMVKNRAHPPRGLPEKKNHRHSFFFSTTTSKKNSQTTWVEKKWHLHNSVSSCR